jgi:cytochrome bd-type quinol oxidase subunit 2
MFLKGAHMMKYDLLVYLALGGVIITIIIIAYVIMKAPERADLETRKIRFAASTCAAIVMLFIFTAVLYFVDATGAGKQIFETAITSMLPLVGVIIGYFFSARERRSESDSRVIHDSVVGGDAPNPRGPADG